jgi:PAS domain S-box-containing protein
VAHRVEDQEGLVRQLRRVYPPQIDVAHPILRVIQTQQPILAEVIVDTDLAARARSGEHLAWLQALDIRSHIVVPLVARGQAIGALSLVRTSASPAYSTTDLALAEEVARRAAQAIDNARLYREAQTLNAYLEHRVAERTAALAEALQTVRLANEGLEREVTVRRQAERRFRHLLDSAPDATVIVDAAGRIQLANSQTEQLFGYTAEALLGQPVEKLLPERFSDRHQTHRLLYADQPRPRVMGAGLALFGRRQDGTEFPIEVSLGPLQTEEGLLISCAIRDITERQRAADALAAAHAELQTLMQRVQAVREEERAELAREVHDELGQQLSGLKMDVAWLRKRLPPEAPQLSDKLEAMSDLLDVAIKSVRHIASELRPGLLDDFGLLAAMEWQLHEFEQRSGLTTHFHATRPELALPPATATAVYRVFQESLTNIARHAQATAVSVTADVQHSVVLLEIHDDGQGFDPASIAQKHTLGLAGMRERVQACAGSLAIHSLPGNGTTVQVRIPLSEPSA